jgi:ComF family protein
MDSAPPQPLPGPQDAPPAAEGWRRWLGRAGRSAGAALEGATRLVYPPVCVACQHATADPHALCARCWGEMGFIARPYCERLGTPFAVDIGGRLLSPQAIADPPVFARARACCRYSETARGLIHRLKYGDRTELSIAMARMMALAGRELIADCAVVVPVPLHWTRSWRRRFNQSALLARQIARISGLPLALEGVERVRRTQTQVGLTRDQRRKNLRAAFRPGPAAPREIEGRRVLLVDDVLTSGATANAVSRALLKGGASAVDVLTFARVVPGDA